MDKTLTVCLEPAYHTMKCNCNKHVHKLRYGGGDLLIKGPGLLKLIYGKACTWKQTPKHNVP